VQIRPFHKGDLEGFKYDGMERDVLPEDILSRTLINFYKAGPCFTGVIDGKVVGFAGLFPLGDNVGYAWAYINKEAYPEIKNVIISMRKVIRRDNYRRTQAMCINTPRARRFLEAIGFKKEGVMRQMLPDTDMVMYSILRGEL